MDDLLFLFCWSWTYYACFEGKEKIQSRIGCELLVNILYGLYLIHYLSNLGLVTHFWMNVHMVIRIVLNLILPVMGVIMYKQYKAKNTFD